MFCPNCGKELKSGGAFCPNCGARVGAAKGNLDSEKSEGHGFDARENCRNGLNAIGEKKLTYFASVLLQIISIFLIGNKMFKVSCEFVYKFSNEYTLFEGGKAVRIIFILGYVVAAAAILLPLLSGKEWKKAYFAPGICMPVVSLLWLLIVIIHVLGEMNSSEYKALFDAVNVSVKLTSNGWIFLLVSVAGLLVTFLASKIPENNGTKPDSQTSNQIYKVKTVGANTLAPSGLLKKWPMSAIQGNILKVQGAIRQQIMNNDPASNQNPTSWERHFDTSGEALSYLSCPTLKLPQMGWPEQGCCLKVEGTYSGAFRRVTLEVDYECEEYRMQAIASIYTEFYSDEITIGAQKRYGNSYTEDSYVNKKGKRSVIIYGTEAGTSCYAAGYLVADDILYELHVSGDDKHGALTLLYQWLDMF